MKKILKNMYVTPISEEIRMDIQGVIAVSDPETPIGGDDPE